MPEWPLKLWFERLRCLHRSTASMTWTVLVIMLAAPVAHLAAAALHPTLAVLCAAAWAVAAAAVHAHHHGSPQQVAWLALFAALQLCDAATGSLALLAWHRLPWKHRMAADSVDALCAASASTCAAMMCVGAILDRNQSSPQSARRPEAERRSALLLVNALMAVAAVALATCSVGASAGLPITAHTGLSDLWSSALGLMFLVSPLSIKGGPERRHFD